mgnify:CR=1 FL=1
MGIKKEFLISLDFLPIVPVISTILITLFEDLLKQLIVVVALLQENSKIEFLVFVLIDFIGYRAHLGLPE